MRGEKKKTYIRYSDWYLALLTTLYKNLPIKLERKHAEQMKTKHTFCTIELVTLTDKLCLDRCPSDGNKGCCTEVKETIPEWSAS